MNKYVSKNTHMKATWVLVNPRRGVITCRKIFIGLMESTARKRATIKTAIWVFVAESGGGGGGRGGGGIDVDDDG
jgi:hypothetical protein